MDLPSVQARPHPNQIRHSLGEALLSMNTSPLNEKLSLRPDQERRQGQADAALPHLPEWNEYLLRLVEKGKSPAGNRTVTLLNHYMTEKSILVMIDPRPTIVPREPGLLLEDSIVIHWNRPRVTPLLEICPRGNHVMMLSPYVFMS